MSNFSDKIIIFVALIGMTLFGIWVSTENMKIQKTMHRNNDYIIFENTKEIIDTLGILENDFIEVNSYKAIKE